MSDEVKKNEYSDTLNLPKTDFPIRAQFATSDATMLKRWDDEKLSEATFNHNVGNEKFILHDGPPYANGNIHLGHAYNKISKDIITKSERMAGKHVPVIPGWDCHGLPIELKVAQTAKESSIVLSREELKKECRIYAQKWIDVQRTEFKKLGVMMHWEKPYATMDFLYEASILRAFKEFVTQGYIAKKLKTVPWCASCQTVLANAEIEYAERKDPSIYVQFPLPVATVATLFPSISNRQVSLLIWTTTPWTLPLNRAVVLKPGAIYALVDMGGKLVVMGKDLVEKIAAVLSGGGVAGSVTASVLQTFASELLIGRNVQHPFIEHLLVPIIGDGFVSLEDGTACVHSAPGCGPEDYEVGVKNNLEIYSPISADGKYTSEIIPVELAGMSVTDGQIWVIKKLAELDLILFKQSIRHSFPHCWRCRNGLIFRATSQWFCDLSQHNLKNRAMEAIQNLTMIPEAGKNRFSATLEGRLEWCLSRQRTWGVPIPALNCIDCGDVFTSPDLIEVAACGVQKEGVEFWDRVSVVELQGLLKNSCCEKCGSHNLGKEFDILDVWFESGVSHFAVLLNNSSQSYPADMYLEGKDQHRAWFQSSLLTALVLEQSPCMKEILTHGFTVDSQGKKMSKSLGNVVTPGEIVDQVGTDGLRLWVASSDYDSDPVVSALLLKNISEVYRKVRNTSRFLLSNLYDFNILTDAVPVEDMMAIDQFAIVRLHQFNTDVQSAYRQRKTTAVFHALADYCAKDLSALYLDVIKDRLYVEKADGKSRRSAQTVCYNILHTMTTVMAPVLSLTAEQIFDCYKSGDQLSIHLQDFADTKTLFDSVLTMRRIEIQAGDDCAKNDSSAELFMKSWDNLSIIRDLILKALEILRGQGVIKHSLDARVDLHITSEFSGFASVQDFFNVIKGQTPELFFKEYCIVSQFIITATSSPLMVQVLPGLFLSVSKADGLKCNRCWQWAIDLTPSALCCRCAAVLTA